MGSTALQCGCRVCAHPENGVRNLADTTRAIICRHAGAPRFPHSGRRTVLTVDVGVVPGVR